MQGFGRASLKSRDLRDTQSVSDVFAGRVPRFNPLFFRTPCSPARARTMLRDRGDWPKLKTITVEEAESDFYVLAAHNDRTMSEFMRYVEGKTVNATP